MRVLRRTDLGIFSHQVRIRKPANTPSPRPTPNQAPTPKNSNWKLGNSPNFPTDAKPGTNAEELEPETSELSSTTTDAKPGTNAEELEPESSELPSTSTDAKPGTNAEDHSRAVGILRDWESKNGLQAALRQPERVLG